MGLKDSANAVYEFAASRHSVFITQRPRGSRTGQDRRDTTPTHKAFYKGSANLLGYIIGTFLKQVEIIREPSHADFISKLP